MEIIHISFEDIYGGAARAAYRLHKALLSSSVNSQMLVQNKASDDYTVLRVGLKVEQAINKFRPTLDSLPVKLYKNRKPISFAPAWLPSGNIIKKIKQINPDIVHLHWICGGMIRIENLVKIKKPIVWSLHDMWAFTGGCHYDTECRKFKNGCQGCPILGSNRKNDLSKKVFDRKRKSFERMDSLTIIGLSKWLKECAKSSLLFKNKKIVNLPNPIDADTFKPIEKVIARDILGLSWNTRLILFGAMGATSVLRKGFKELCEALAKLEVNGVNDIELIVVGGSKPQNAPNLNFKTHYLGHLQDDISLRVIYSAADVMVMPSLQENLSNAIMESLSCARPVVAFDIGGNSDMVEHKRNGYLAKPFDAEDMADGIEWVINNKNYDKLCENAKQKVLTEFDSKVVADKYIQLYEQILKS
jgi:glycosyltransferase involved in cell wall biosynthesis